MSESMAFHISIAFAGGLILGLFYFGTLWLIVQRLARVRKPGLVTLGGFVVRTSLTLAGFFIVMGGHWERAFACMIGFVAMRKLLTYRYGAARPVPPTKEG